MPKTVISNTSPIFYLNRIGHLELVERLYGEIVIPHAVLKEIEEGRKTDEDIPDVGRYKWIKLKSISVPSYIKIIPDLGEGEAEVLALGIEEREHLLIIDDALAIGYFQTRNYLIILTANLRKITFSTDSTGDLREVRYA
jgi:predicted nucleic acid-binding protein